PRRRRRPTRSRGRARPGSGRSVLEGPRADPSLEQGAPEMMHPVASAALLRQGHYDDEFLRRAIDSARPDRTITFANAWATLESLTNLFRTGSVPTSGVNVEEIGCFSLDADD